jgi:hypothetical protein
MDRESEAGGTALELVAREICEGLSLSQEEVEAVVRRVLLDLMGRAYVALQEDPLSPVTLEKSREYLVVSDIIVTFGTTLKALEDIESHGIEGKRRSPRFS